MTGKQPAALSEGGGSRGRAGILDVQADAHDTGLTSTNSKPHNNRNNKQRIAFVRKSIGTISRKKKRH